MWRQSFTFSTNERSQGENGPSLFLLVPLPSRRVDVPNFLDTQQNDSEIWGFSREHRFPARHRSEREVSKAKTTPELSAAF